MASLRPWRGALQLASRQLQGSAGLIHPSAEASPVHAPTAAREAPWPAAAPPFNPPLAPAPAETLYGDCREGEAGARGVAYGALSPTFPLGPFQSHVAPAIGAQLGACSHPHTHSQSHSQCLPQALSLGGTTGRIECNSLATGAAHSPLSVFRSSQARTISVLSPSHTAQPPPPSHVTGGTLRIPTWPLWAPYTAAAAPAPAPQRTARLLSVATATTVPPPSSLALSSTPLRPSSSSSAAAPGLSPLTLAPTPARRFSAAAGPGVPAAILEEDVVPRAGKRRKNLVDVLWRNPQWGVGARVAKRHWAPGTFYQVTRVEINKSGRTGRAWGIYHEGGAPMSAELRMGGVNKAGWKQIRDLEGAGAPPSVDATAPKEGPEA